MKYPIILTYPQNGYIIIGDALIENSTINLIKKSFGYNHIF